MASVFDSVYWDILQETKKEIASLNLSGEKLYIQMALHPIALPGIYITVENVQEDSPGGLNQSDDWSYPVNILIVDRADIDYAKNIPMYLYWRQKIRRHFNNQGNRKMTALSTVYHMVIIPGAVATNVVIERPQAYQLIVSRLLLRVTAREPRG